MTDLLHARLAAIPELKECIAELTELRDKKVDTLVRGVEYAEYVALAGEVRGLNLVIAAPYKPRQRGTNG